MALGDIFLGQLDADARPEMAEFADLEGELGRLWNESREAWPELALSLEDFLSHLARRMRRDLPPAQRLTQLRGPDLYLACACALGSAPALAAFERRYQEELSRAASKLGLTPSARADLLQEVREKLFVARPDRPPAISQYGGRGSLGAWLRVTCTNLGLNRVEALGRQRREVPLHEQALGALADDSEDPELRLLKTLYRAEFRQAFKEAWSTQPERERTLLLLNHVEGLGIDAISRMYQVHRATAARWLNEARGGLLRRTRAALAGRLGLGSAELDSIIRLIESRLDVTLSSLAAEPSADQDPGG